MKRKITQIIAALTAAGALSVNASAAPEESAANSETTPAYVLPSQGSPGWTEESLPEETVSLFDGDYSTEHYISEEIIIEPPVDYYTTYLPPSDFIPVQGSTENPNTGHSPILPAMGAAFAAGFAVIIISGKKRK